MVSLDKSSPVDGSIQSVLEESQELLPIRQTLLAEEKVTEEPDTLTSTSARQRRLLDHLQQHRLILQGQHERLYNLLPSISQPGQLQSTDVAPNNSPRYLTEELESPSLSAWLNHQRQHDQGYTHVERDEDDSMDYDRDDKSGSASSGLTSHPSNAMEEDVMPASTSDFVKKLYRMLDDPSFQSVVCWGPMGDCFVVKDMNECMKSVLPRMFKHSNFASFVRQLNKYDFHKVKNTLNNPYGEHSWTFQHPEFRANRPEALDRVQRKPSASRKTIPTSRPYSSSPSVDKDPKHRHSRNSSLDLVQTNLEQKSENQMEVRMANLEENQQRILEEMVGFQQCMVRQDGLMHSLIAQTRKSEDATASSTDPSAYSILNPAVRASKSTLVSEAQLQSLTAAEARKTLQTQVVGSPYSQQSGNIQSQRRYFNTTESSPQLDQYNSSNNDGMTNGYQQSAYALYLPDSISLPSPSYSRSTEESSRRDGNLDTDEVSDGSCCNGDQSNPNFDNDAQSSFEEIRTPFFPGWPVPPHILLVDDDAVSRRLISKILEVAGCTIDVAVDGISAVNKMDLEKYDLVLMDIVMPKLDGVSATNLIRKFDKGTPIISMSGNSSPNQIMTYFSSGMKDILAKPFTKKDLLDILEKHLVHHKITHHTTNLPLAIGGRPISNSNFEDASTTSATNLFMLQQQRLQTGGSLTPSFGPMAPPNHTPDEMVSRPSPFNFPLYDGSSNEAQINPFTGIAQSIGNSPSPPLESESDITAWSLDLDETMSFGSPKDERGENGICLAVIA